MFGDLHDEERDMWGDDPHEYEEDIPVTDMDRAGAVERAAGGDPSKVPTYAPKDDEPTTHAERVEKDRPAYPSLYCAVWPDLVPIARSLGYALTIHGSLSRDLDLIAVPWTEEAVDAETLVRAIADKFGAWVGAADLKMERTRKPHGRMGAIIVLGGHAVVDLSIMPRANAALTADRDALAALLKEARPLLYAMGFDRKAPEDILSRIDAALARIDAASGRKPC